MEAATDQFQKMPTSNPWDYARAVVKGLREQRMIDPARERWQADGSLPGDLPQCMLCDEVLEETSSSEVQPIHRACALRSVVGGIGHLIAHDLWCVERKDPDAGLTYRQSALCVDEYIACVGFDKAVGHDA
jgi:hypothetical protein